MGTEEEAERIVREFCVAFGTRDPEALRPYLADDVVYHNIPLEPAVGIEDTLAFIEGFFGMFESAAIENLHVAVRGNVVLTERIDTLTSNGVVEPLPVMGTFDIRDGKISAWRDYFDMGQITQMLS